MVTMVPKSVREIVFTVLITMMSAITVIIAKIRMIMVLHADTGGGGDDGGADCDICGSDWKLYR